MTDSFPMIQLLECSQVQPIVSKKVMKIIIRLSKLQQLSIKGNEDTGDALLAEVVKATGLTCLHFHSAEVSLNSSIKFDIDVYWRS